MVIPEPARRALQQRLDQRRQQRWTELNGLTVRYRGDFAYVTATTIDGDLPLCRLRYLRSPGEWGFAAYLASRDGYEDSILPSGSFTATPEAALDCACGLYLRDITAWTDAQPDS